MTRFNRSRAYRTVTRSNRYRPVLAIVLLLLAAFLIFKLSGVGGINEGNYEAQRNTRLRSEVQHAVSSVNSLSRLGASSTSAMLGRIRAYVHGAEVLNDLNVSMYGEVGRIYSQDIFDTIYAIIEEYDTRLASGQKVNETLTSLSEAINALSVLTNELLNPGA